MSRTRDKEGVDFWTEQFGEVDKTDVSAFAEKLATVFRKDIDPLITYKVVDHVIGKDDGDGGEEFITLEQWEAFLAKFGPFAECMNRTKASMIDRFGHVIVFCAAPFSGMEAGYFLVRYGSQEVSIRVCQFLQSDRDKLVMSYARIKDEDGKRAFVTKSTYIVIDPKKGYHMSSDSDAPGRNSVSYVCQGFGTPHCHKCSRSEFAVHNKGSTSYSYYGDKDKKGGDTPLPRYVKRPLNKYSYTRHTAPAPAPTARPTVTSSAAASHYAHYTGEAASAAAHAAAASSPAPTAKHVAPAPGAMYAAYNDQGIGGGAAGAKGGSHHPLTHQTSGSAHHSATVQNVAQNLIARSGHAEKGAPTSAPAHASSHAPESNYAAYGGLSADDGKHGHRGSGSEHPKKDSKKDAKHAPAPASTTYASYDINAQPPAGARGVDRVQSTPVSRLTHATSGLSISASKAPAAAAAAPHAVERESNYQTYEEASGGPAARNQTFAGNSHGPVHGEKSAAGSAYHAYQGFTSGKR